MLVSDNRAGNQNDSDLALRTLLEESFIKVTVLGMENERLCFELDHARQMNTSSNVDSEHRNSQTQHHIREKERQIEHLNTQMIDKNKEIELLTQRNNGLENMLKGGRFSENENVHLKNKVETLEINLNQNQSSNIELLGEITRLRSYEKENSYLTGKIMDLESRIKFVTNANEKLNRLVGERADEAKNWQIRLSDANSTASRIPDLENKVRLLVVENERLEKDVINYTEKFLTAEKRMSGIPELENRIRLLATENERLQNILTDYCNKFNEFECKASSAVDLECRLKTMTGENSRQQKFIGEIQNRLSEVESRAQLIPGFEDKTRL